MNIEEITEKLQDGGLTIVNTKELPNGQQLKISNGALVNVFTTGTINVQGKNADKVREILSVTAAKDPPATYITKSKTTKSEVFVVYGHDEDARTQLEAMLRRWNLKPLILDQLPSEGQTIIEKLEKYTSVVDFCVVLATPDDEGNRKGKEDEKAYRARQNVVLELGMMLALLGRDKVAILLKDQVKMERPSDIQGLIYIPFKEDVKECSLLLAKEMTAKGYNINVQDL